MARLQWWTGFCFVFRGGLTTLLFVEGLSGQKKGKTKLLFQGLHLWGQVKNVERHRNLQIIAESREIFLKEGCRYCYYSCRKSQLTTRFDGCHYPFPIREKDGLRRPNHSCWSPQNYAVWVKEQARSLQSPKEYGTISKLALRDGGEKRIVWFKWKAEMDFVRKDISGKGVFYFYGE